MEKNDTILKKLADIVGEDRLMSEPGKMDFYSEDQSYTPGKSPDCVVFPENTEEVQDNIKLANELKVPVVPRSSAVSLHGASIPEGWGHPHRSPENE